MAALRKLLQQIALLTFALTSTYGANVDPDIIKEIDQQGLASVIVEFETEPIDEAVDCYERKKRSPGAGTFEDLAKELMGIAQRSQARAIDQVHTTATARSSRYGDQKIIPYNIHQLWTTNELVIENADRGLIDEFSKRSDVRSIKSDPIIPLTEDTVIDQQDCSSEEEFDSVRKTRSAVENASPMRRKHRSRMTREEPVPPTTPEPKAATQVPSQPLWNMKMINVAELWKNNITGQGAVVGIISTGVNFFHEAVRSKFRSEKGWYDPVQGGKTPYDDDQSEIGTRSASIILGGKVEQGFGVAPNAKWIACRASHKGETRLSNLKVCLQFMACPTDTRFKNPDCSLRPKVVHISAGSFQKEGNKPFSIAFGSIMVLKSAGILVVWAMGDSKEKECGPSHLETRHPYVVSVAALDETGARSNWSRVGITSGNSSVPTISAPGGPVYAATVTNEMDKYDNKSLGTFVAAAHVAGIAALLAQVNPNITGDAFKTLVKNSVDPVKSSGTVCGVDKDVEPGNAFYGAGLLNAFKAWKTLTGG